LILTLYKAIAYSSNQRPFTSVSPNYGMEEENQLDEKYTIGIWYNAEIGEFEKYENDGDEVAIFSPDGEKLDTVTYLETGHLKKVKNKARVNPVEYYEELVDWFMTTSGGIERLPYDDEISFKYARRQVEIVEE